MVISKEIESKSREVLDFPKKGISCKDITPLLMDKNLSDKIILEFKSRVIDLDIDAVIGIESRGFLYGFLLANKLGVPFIPIRKSGKLPGKTIKYKYDLEYGFGIFELMQGSGMNSPSTYRGTLVVDEFGQRRIKSRRDDIENFLNQCAKVAVPLMQQIYTEEKVIRLVQPNGLEKEQRFNFFKEMDNGDVMRFHDVTLGRYDVKVVSGSTLPTNRMAMLNTYMQMYQAGLIDQVEVLKKSELVDIDGVLQRSGQAVQMQQQMNMLQEELKKVKGDLQTATREELHAKKRLEVEKFSSDLDKISNRAESATQLYKARIADVENNLMNSVSSVEKDLAEELDVEPALGEMES